MQTNESAIALDSYISQLTAFLKAKGIQAACKQISDQGAQLEICGQNVPVETRDGGAEIVYSSLSASLARELMQFEPVLNIAYVQPPLIGSDESGKGDLFGALCVASCYCGQKEYSALSKMGIKDSKLLTDKAMLGFEQRIKSLCETEAAILEPARYNASYKAEPNMSILLGKLHARAIDGLIASTGCETVLVDKFSPSNRVVPYIKSAGANISEFPKAEKNIAVAAASILARCEFLRSIDRISEEFGLRIPLGAGKQADEAAKRIYEERGYEGLYMCAKVNFSNISKAISQ
ncbi:MAG: ribonuclease HIII [Eubacteriaceae bacterium]|jgi:ribonuclease HIII|nr:ribonuclease HIII [Eubacteriaceae bacterium]